jgi:hypothetical protein
LSSVLRQLLEAPDPAAFATERGLHLAGDQVRVVVELLQPEADLAEVYGLQAEGRYRNLVQALAPLSTLCALGGDERVRLVRAPFRATPG